MKILLTTLAAILLLASPALAQQYQIVPSCGTVALTAGSSQGYMDQTGAICTAGGGGGGGNAAAATIGSTAPTSAGVTASVVHSIPLSSAAPNYTAGTVQPFTISPQGALAVELYQAGSPVGDGNGVGAFTGVHPIGVSGFWNSTPTTAGASPVKQLALQTDHAGNLQTQTGGARSALNITAAGVVLTGFSHLHRIIFNNTTATTTATTIIDSTTTTVTAANTVMVIPAAAGTPGAVIDVEWPFLLGLTIVPGTGAVLSVSYD